jgi:PGF-CTERM protein
MREVDAEEGAFLHTVVISADWIDYSNCDVDNTAAFGFDRGNNNSGTRTDEDLVSRRKDDEFRDDGLTVTFYTWDDIGGDPPYGAPEDAIVAEQGARSSGGACLTMTSEPGWYQVQGFVNGTEADNGPDQRPSEDANHAGILAKSNYIYVCECDSRAEAEERLGPPPGPGGTPTPTPTSTDRDDPTPTPTAGGGPTPTPTEPPTDARNAAATGTAGGTGDGPTETGPDGDGGPTTPTADGPGFGPVAALLALLASALIANRRG